MGKVNIVAVRPGYHAKFGGAGRFAGPAECESKGMHAVGRDGNSGSRKEKNLERMQNQEAYSSQSLTHKITEQKINQSYQKTYEMAGRTH
jgi:hypothetical protein